MVKKSIKPIALILILCTLFSANTFAGSTGKSSTVITVANDGEWHGSTSVNRSKSYSYVTLWCDYVIPSITGISDNFNTVQVSAKNSGGTLVGASAAGKTKASFVTMTENSSTDSKLYIIEGYLNLSTVYLCYRDTYTWVPIRVKMYYNGN